MILSLLFDIKIYFDNYKDDFNNEKKGLNRKHATVHLCRLGLSSQTGRFDMCFYETVLNVRRLHQKLVSIHQVFESTIIREYQST